MLPDVEDEKRGRTMRDRLVGVMVRSHLELAVLEVERGPSAGEMANRFGLELVDQGVDRSERFIDEIEQGPSRLFLLRAEPQPIEAVVPDLPDLVEETLGAISGGQFDQLEERLALQRGVGGDQ